MTTLRADRRRRARTRRPRALLAVHLAAVVTAVLGVVVPQLATPAGASVPVGSPGGQVEHLKGAPGGLTISGWAYDPNTSAPISVFVTLDGRRVTTPGGTTLADVSRPDLAKRHPGAVRHGYRTVVTLPAGTHSICVEAVNAAKTPGANRRLGCYTRTLRYSPDGQVQSFKTVPGALHVAGWAFDSDMPASPITVRVSIDSTVVTRVASRTNTAAAKKHPYGGARHGFSLTIPTPQGVHTVCITAVNVGYGSNVVLRCGTLTLAESPVGALNSVGQAAGKLRVRGWAFDPDAPTTALSVAITVDGATQNVTANVARNDVAAAHAKAGPLHGFDQSFTLPEGRHEVCVTARNISYGSNLVFGCRTVTLNFTPTASITSLIGTPTGLAVTGWATDPDTRKPIHVRVAVDRTTLPTLTANRTGPTHSGHVFSATSAAHSGAHTVCAVAVNALYGTHNSPRVCRSVTLALGPLGSFQKLTRSGSTSNLVATGWTFDPDTTAPIQVTLTLDGTAVGTSYPANVSRPDVLKAYPSAGSAAHGFAVPITADAGEHTVCVVAENVGGGTDRTLGCRVIDAVHPVAPSAVRSVSALAGYGGATVTWQAPASDGGAPWTKYTVTALTSAGAVAGSVSASPGATTATVTGLKPRTAYRLTVSAVNVAGSSPVIASALVTTQASPPPQTTPAPVSTSRYIRNVTSATAADLATMRREGYADARANPSGHGYLILLDIGGQDEFDGGVVLSATTHFVSYPNLVEDVNAYVDGYHSGQRSSAPVTIAIGTNNDVDVSASSGRSWADRVVDPVRAHTTQYAGIVVAGADDIEPGFRATYTQTKAWLQGYLGATNAPFIFNGSADGCAWTVTGRGCNNGWTMAGLYYLAAGAAPVRTLNLPQIYNDTMAAQWKYISLTGVQGGSPRIDFGGPLTEYTACDQSSGCGSLTGHSAWSQLWSNLQSDTRLKVASLPYSTDLRIDR